VVLAVESFFIEEQTIDGIDDARYITRTFETLPHSVAPRAHLIEVRRDVERRLILERDHQRRLDQIELALAELRDLDKSLARQRRMRQYTCVHSSTLRRSSSVIGFFEFVVQSKRTTTTVPVAASSLPSSLRIS